MISILHISRNYYWNVNYNNTVTWCMVVLPVYYTCFTVLLSGVGHAIFPNILPQNHQQPMWNLLGGCFVSIVLGPCLRNGIHKVPCVIQGHHLLFVLHLRFHIPPSLPVWRCIHCAPRPWDFIYIWIMVGSWIYVSQYTLLYPCNYLG